MPTRVILVRHGQSTFNAAKRFQGRCDDSKLTTNGLLSAYQTGLALNHIAFDAVYSSPLKRTQETAQEMLTAIAAVFNAEPPMYTHANLQEIHLPEWQGLSYQEVRSQFAEAYRQWQETPHLLRMKETQPTPMGPPEHSTLTTLAPAVTTFSPLQHLYAQAQAFWQEILPKHRDQTLLVISHGGTIRALISTAIGLNISQYHLLQQSNSGVSELLFVHPEQPAQLHAVNLTGHLGEILPKLKNGKQGMRMVLLPIDRNHTEMTSLITRLKAIPLDFCLIDTSDHIPSVASQLLSHHPNAGVQLQINQPDFLSSWHHSIHPRMKAQIGLSTGLFITSIDTVHSFLHNTLHRLKHHQSLVLEPGTLTILYYPASTQHPVLQAMNLGTDRFDGISTL